MRKQYIVEFTYLDGRVENVELLTDNLENSIEQWTRNRAIAKYEILEEGQSNSKQMLFG